MTIMSSCSAGMYASNKSSSIRSDKSAINTYVRCLQVVWERATPMELLTFAGQENAVICITFRIYGVMIFLVAGRDVIQRGSTAQHSIA